MELEKDVIQYELADNGICTIWLNRPHKRNCVSPQLLRADSTSRLASNVDPVVNDMGGQFAYVRPSLEDLDALTELIESGKVTVFIASTYPLAETQKAWDESKEGHTRGKIVITVP